jgi:hypothetical protein
MTSSTLRNSRVSENQITYKRTHTHSQHDPSVISHEEQPIFVSLHISLEHKTSRPGSKEAKWKGNGGRE